MKNNNGIKVNNGFCPVGKCWVLHAESPRERSTSRAPSQPTEHQGIIALITCEPKQGINLYKWDFCRILPPKKKKKKRNWGFGAKPSSSKRASDKFISKNSNAVSRHQIKYALICCAINLGMTECKALSADKNLTLRLPRNHQACSAKPDNSEKYYGSWQSVHSKIIPF